MPTVFALGNQAIPLYSISRRLENVRSDCFSGHRVHKYFLPHKSKIKQRLAKVSKSLLVGSVEG